MKNGMEIGTDLCSEVDVVFCGADLNSNSIACWKSWFAPGSKSFLKKLFAFNSCQGYGLWSEAKEPIWR